MRAFALIILCTFGLVAPVGGNKDVEKHIADLEGLEIPASLSGLVARNNDRKDGSSKTRALKSPFEVGDQGLLSPELVDFLRDGLLASAKPEDFDLSQQVCPRFDDDPKYGLDLLRLLEEGYQSFFYSESLNTGGGRETAETPGLCTTTYLSHEQIKERIAALPGPQIRSLTKPTVPMSLVCFV